MCGPGSLLEVVAIIAYSLWMLVWMKKPLPLTAIAMIVTGVLGMGPSWAIPLATLLILGGLLLMTGHTIWMFFRWLKEKKLGNS
jgi:hypothetical protein